MAAPATTSVGQCTPVWTRLYPTAAASGTIAAAASGYSMVTADANAAADAECPDGNDDGVGLRDIRRSTGSSSAAGRRRGNSRLPTKLAAKLAKPMATTPRSPALRGSPLRLASSAATANQSLLWSAAWPSSRKPLSAGVGG